MGSSDLVPREVFGSHVLTIHSYTLTRGVIYGDFINAGTFAAAGHDWPILYYPNGDFSKKTDWISLYLKLHRPTTHGAAAGAVKARFRFSLLGVDGRPARGYSKGSDDGAGYKVFVPMTTKQGFRKFIRRDALAWKSGCLLHDCFSVRCDITVLNVTYKHRVQRVAPAAAAPERFVVMPPSSVDRDLGGLLASGKGADVVFEVAGETFAVHRNILATRSLVFMEELFGPTKDMATGRVHVHDMAVRRPWYSLERLKLICEDNLCNYIETSTVGTILTLAEQHGCYGLRKACLQFLMSGNNLKAAIQTGGFDHLTNSCPSVLKELLSKLTIG
ncbi:hypothetical protein BS78_K169000 [Paspalum vaginatum]|uniref:BTB domain-containing protein n=1 Tax=Paspalum vaginatum TaxID=158149 RepID=A0A9W7XB71_9POAL|nr:hypothetical protein BS78_K169000 [Paspalum vaginatum]